MSDLHNLSAPIEDSHEEIAKKEEIKQASQKEVLKQNLQRLFIQYREKYLKKLLLSVGIAVVVAAVILWLVSLIFTSNETIEPTEPSDIVLDENPVETDTVKFIKFDGHQYYFYVPEDYSFLNRTRNDDLNEVAFSHSDGGPAFVLYEFEAGNDAETTLDSIYSYISTTLTPDENTEIKIGENTFKRRVYRACEPKTEEMLRQEAETGETHTASVTCVLGDEYYSTYINGLVIIFEKLNYPDDDFEENILATFTKNVIDSNVLSEEYIYGKVPNVETPIQAKFAFGTPISEEEKNSVTEITWNTATHLGIKIILGFDQSKTRQYAYGTFGAGGSSKFDLGDAITNQHAEIDPHEAYSRILDNSSIRSQILKTSPTAEFLIDDKIPEDNFWEVTITSSEEDGSILLGEYTVTKDTGQVSIK